MIWQTGIAMLQSKPAQYPRGINYAPVERSVICAKAAAASIAIRKTKRDTNRDKVLAAVAGKELNAEEVGRIVGIGKAYAYNLLCELLAEGRVSRTKVHDWHYYKALI